MPLVQISKKLQIAVGRFAMEESFKFKLVSLGNEMNTTKLPILK